MKTILYLIFAIIILAYFFPGNGRLTRAKDWIIDTTISACEYERAGGITRALEGR